MILNSFLCKLLQGYFVNLGLGKLIHSLLKKAFFCMHSKWIVVAWYLTVVEKRKCIVAIEITSLRTSSNVLLRKIHMYGNIQWEGNSIRCALVYSHTGYMTFGNVFEQHWLHQLRNGDEHQSPRIRHDWTGENFTFMGIFMRIIV